MSPLWFLAILATASAADDCYVTNFEDVEDAVATCDSIIIKDLTVPAGTQLQLPLLDGATLVFEGVINFTAGVDWSGPMMLISGKGINVKGAEGSVLNGQGKEYWDGLGSWADAPKPKFVRIEPSENSVFSDIFLKNCPMHCVTISNCENVTLDGWTIDNIEGDAYMEPYGSWGHNTDGFDISYSYNITINNSLVYNQDDCVAVNSGAHMFFSNFYCHGSHGLSISVGFSQDNYDDNSVNDINFMDSTVVDGENAIHIKTHADAGLGSVANVTYRNIRFSGSTKYGLNIQEDYEDGHGTGIPKPNIPITNLVFEDITGTVNPNATAVYILCAQRGCYNWNWSSVSVDGGLGNNCTFTPNGFDC